MLPRERGFPSGSRMNRIDTCKGRIVTSEIPNENERRSIMRLALRTIVRACLVSLLLTLSVYESRAQGSAVASGTAGRIRVEEIAAKSSGTAVNDTRYRIGPGDCLRPRSERRNSRRGAWIRAKYPHADDFYSGGLSNWKVNWRKHATPTGNRRAAC